MLNATEYTQENDILRKVGHRTEFSQKSGVVLNAFIEIVIFDLENSSW